MHRRPRRKLRHVKQPPHVAVETPVTRGVLALVRYILPVTLVARETR